MKKKNVIKNNKNRRRTAIILSIILITSTMTAVSFSTASVSKTERISTMSSSKSGWETQESGITHTLWGVSFVDTNIGTVVGDSATILHTEDEGETWTSQTCEPSVDLLDVSLYDADTGVAVGASGTILNTIDGGDTWNTVQTGWMITYYGAQMVTSTLGFAVGVNTIFQPLVTWTTNGWQTLNNIAFYLVHNSVFYEGNLRDVHFIDSSTGFAAATVWNGEGAIVRTINGGSNWETIYWASHAFLGIDFPSANVGYAVGNNGIIAKTSDGGDNWELLNSGVSNSLSDVSFPTEDIGTVVGETGLIIRTTDGGDTWSVQESGTIYTLYAVQFLDPLNGFVVGDQGTILHTTTGGMENLPPDTPGAPDGPDEGITDVEYEFSAVTTDPDEDQIYYNFSWGDGTYSGWIGSESSGTPVEESHVWDEAGDYDVKVKAKDVNDAESDWSDPLVVTIIGNNPPDAPTITGETNGKKGTEYEYTFNTVDPDGDNVSYYIKWGDGDVTDWTAFQASGPPGYSDSHVWDEQGTYTIEAKAKDTFGAESNWGELTVTMPRNRAYINTPFLRFLKQHLNLFPILQTLLQRLGLN